MRKVFLLLAILSFTGLLSAQSAILRGNVFDGDTGEPISFGTVRIQGPGGLNRGDNTDVDGFFSFANLPTGDYRLIASYVGYDSLVMNVNLAVENEIEYQRLNLISSGVQLQTVAVSARREQARSDVAVSKVTFSAAEIMAIPATGGEADIAQYLTVLPGVVSSGDQGGQLYIRGGSPVQNKLLLDGMTILIPSTPLAFSRSLKRKLFARRMSIRGGSMRSMVAGFLPSSILRPGRGTRKNSPASSPLALSRRRCWPKDPSNRLTPKPAAVSAFW